MNEVILSKKDQHIQHFFRWDLIEDAVVVGPHHHPQLKGIEHVEFERIVLFNLAKYEKHPEVCALAFYNKDDVLESIWRNPQKYIPLIKRFKVVIGLDFSILRNMYYPQQAYNSWRNYVLDYVIEKEANAFVPNVGYGDYDTLDWAFDGLPEGKVLAVSTQSCMQTKEDMQSLLNGLHQLVRTKHPSELIIYGKFPDEWRSRFNVPIKVYPSYAEEKWGDNRG